MDGSEIKRQTRDTSPRHDTLSRLVIGLALIAGGLLFTLDNFGLVDVGDLWRFWPLVLVAWGLAKFANRSFFAGTILVALGTLISLREFGLLHFHLRYLLPLIFVFIGLRIVFAHRPGARTWDASTNPGGTLNEWAVFGGGERRFVSSDFHGGQANAVFGGFNIDLRESKMVGDRATIDETKPDLLFLDVQMPQLDGLEVLELIERDAAGRPAVIFVTAYDQYALKAFDANAVDYLLKPFDRSRFETALASLEVALPKERFVRIHRSYLLNLDRLVRLEPSATGAPMAVLPDGARLPVSRTGAQRLHDRLGR